MLENLFDINFKNNSIINCDNRELYTRLIIYLFDSSKNGDLLLVVPSLSEANKVYNDLINYRNDVFLFPEDDYLTKQALASSPEFLMSRMNFLNSLKSVNKKIVITNLNGYVKKLPSPKKFDDFKLVFKKGNNFNRKEVVKLLDEIGYKKESLVTETGEYSIRGFVIDIFPFNYEHPVRIELSFDEVGEIKLFNELDQRSIRKLEVCEVLPLTDEFNTSSLFYLKDYLNESLVVFQDVSQIVNVENNINEQKKYYEDFDFLNFRKIDVDKKLFINILTDDINSNYDFSATSLTFDINSVEKLEDFVKTNKNVYFYYQNSKLLKKIDHIPIKKFNLPLNHSFKFHNNCYISEKDVFNLESHKSYKSNFKLGTKVGDLTNLEIGDFVVHKKHGIGIYNGIKTIEKNGVKKDYILINYKGNDKLYIPAQNITSLYKYSSKDGTKPKIYKLNSAEWEKVKYKIRNRAKDISNQLIKIYSERAKVKIVPFEKDTPEQAIFENEFPYEFTTDQLKVTNEIKRDLESSKPMERLLCGDVGYGKTEVLFRSMFKTVMNNKQVAYLCPTTLLAKQQYNSALKRFANHAINIKLVTRHTSSSEINKIIVELREGKVDILFGTHRLFNKQFEYKDLGLLVVDEEHRFGVEHKEKMKEIRKDVNVLSVSATPIPRSLQMSLVGIRDMSLIATPPLNRFPVQTYVINYDLMLLKEVLLNELNRDGQAFVLFNNVEKIDSIKNKLKEILPSVRIDYIHGKMNKNVIDDIMTKFVNKEIDILVATTIIENGIDVPNANTMVVIDADRFGLSQLYQIRGRVGRGDRIAYAYFMYDSSKILTETAKKRLEAIKEFTKLGSGYKISMRDLSIRGAGDLLGKEQAGFIDSVGVDMYLDLINSELSNEDEPDENSKNNLIMAEVETHINENYTNEDEIIIELHKNINDINSEEDYYKVYDEIKDRFGLVDESLEKYLDQELLESYLNNFNIPLITNNSYKISFKLEARIYQKLNIEDFFIEAMKINSKFNFKYQDNYILISLSKIGNEQVFMKHLNKLFHYILIKTQ